MDYSREEAAKRAGVSGDELTRLVELGVLGSRDTDRFTPADIRKVGLFQSMVAGGLPLEGLVAELKTGRLSVDFLENPAFDMFSHLGTVTFEDLSVSTGIPVDVLMVIREAIGSSVPRPTDLVRDNELAVVPLLQAQLDVGYSPEAVERGLRTEGDSLRRLTTAEAAAFRIHVIEPIAVLPDIHGEQIGAAASAATERIRGRDDDALLAIYHGQQMHAWTASILEGWERDLAAAGLLDAISRPPAMCFLDITGFTRLTQERGDDAAAALADQLTRLVQRNSVQHGGRPVKWLGDGVMLYFRSPGPGVMAALDMSDGVTDAGLPPAHVGLHAGPVVIHEGDYYGQTVNLASRIAEYARPGEVIVSQAVVEASEGVGATFTEIGPVELKGVTGPVQLHIARRS
jgi:adenylate cyclase